MSFANYFTSIFFFTWIYIYALISQCLIFSLIFFVYMGGLCVTKRVFSCSIANNAKIFRGISNESTCYFLFIVVVVGSGEGRNYNLRYLLYIVAFIYLHTYVRYASYSKRKILNNSSPTFKSQMVKWIIKDGKLLCRSMSPLSPSVILSFQTPFFSISSSFFTCAVFHPFCFICLIFVTLWILRSWETK